VLGILLEVLGEYEKVVIRWVKYLTPDNIANVWPIRAACTIATISPLDCPITLSHCEPG
jgi:hypothetical protein